MAVADSVSCAKRRLVQRLRTSVSQVRSDVRSSFEPWSLDTLISIGDINSASGKLPILPTVVEALRRSCNVREAAS